MRFLSVKAVPYHGNETKNKKKRNLALPCIPARRDPISMCALGPEQEKIKQIKEEKDAV